MNYCKDLSEATEDFGHKAFNLGRLIKAGFQVPPGICVRLDPAFSYQKMVLPLLGLNPEDKAAFGFVSKKVTKEVYGSALPPAFVTEVTEKTVGLKGPFAVRSSACNEDSYEESLAGHYESFLNVEDEVFYALKQVYASVYSEKALFYRYSKKILTAKLKMSAIIQEMVKGVSGVAFSRHPDTGENAVFLSVYEGLGSDLVGGKVSGTQYLVRGNRVEFLSTNGVLLRKSRILGIADTISEIERLFDHPVDVEWVADANGLHIVQARPAKIVEKMPGRHPAKVKPVLTGAGIGQGRITGTVIKLKTPEITEFPADGILVVSTTSPAWEPVLRQAAGLITDHGCRTSHAAIVARELGIPAVVGTLEANRVLRNGQKITLDCNEGDIGRIYLN